MKKTMARISTTKYGLFLIGTLALLWPSFLLAGEPQHLRLSLRALGMGNAFVAAANDESSLYYNPAGLASVQRSFFEVLSVNATINQNLLDLGDKTGSDQTAAFGDLVGNKIYFEAGGSLLSYTAPYWGWSTFGGAVLDATIHNPTIPYFELLGYAQYGAIGGFAVTMNDQLIDVGVAMKYVFRAGIGKTLHIVDAADMTALTTSVENDAVNKSQISSDVGATYHIDRWYNYNLKVSAVMKDIGGLDFGSAGSIPTTVNLGIASESEFAGFDLLLASDLVDATFAATETKSFARNFNLGAELGFAKRSNGGHHALAFRLGKKGPYQTTGFSFNPPYLPIMIDYAKWSEEVGAVAGSKEDKRQSIQLSFNF